MPNLQFKFEDSDFRIQFEHAVGNNHGNAPGREKSTHCTILRHDGADWLPFSTGYAKCVDGDQYCKETGRKVSLTRATKQYATATFDRKAWSRAAWECYRGRRG